MIAELKPYPDYKTSGVEWLGDIPEHWEVRRIKSLSLVKRGASPRPIADPIYFDDDGEYAWVRIADVTASSHYLQRTTQRLSQLGQSLSVRLKPGALFLSIAGSVGKPIITKIKCCIHDGFVCFPQLHGSVEFLYRVFSCNAPFARLGKLGTQINLNTDTVGNICLSWPPKTEQTAIVRFLDHADRRIRRYIRAKRKLLALLEEQKQAVIYQAVTGRIDVQTGKPYPTYKASGVEWLGEVPEHWEKPIKVKYVSSLKGRLGWQGLKASEYTSEGPYIVSSAHFHEHKINWAICPHVTQERYEMDEHIQLAQGDILLMKDGAAMGKLAFVDELPSLACLNSHLLLFRPLENDGGETYFPQFMFYYMQTECFQGYVQVNGTGATFLGISQESIGNHKICLPPHSEQVAIVEHLDVATADINIVTSNTNREINLLREYRTRLIADAVTGKLDVREAAAVLPEVDPLEAEDEPDDAIDADVEGAAHELDAVLEEAEA